MINKKILIALIIVLSTSMAALHADGNVLETWKTGLLLYSDETVDIWWSAGTFRIMPDTRQPEEQGDTIRLKMAGNEYESVQVVVRNRKPLNNVRLKVSDLNRSGKGSNFSSTSGGNDFTSSGGVSNFSSPGGVISSSESSVRKVEYIYVSKPTDSYGSKGWWPDPLPLVEGAINLEAGINNTFFVTLYSQPHQQAGIYHGDITISWRNFKKTIPVEIEIWDFSLPRTPSIRSGFGLSYDKIAA